MTLAGPNQISGPVQVEVQQYQVRGAPHELADVVQELYSNYVNFNINVMG